jgi:hypothetical protein
MSKQLHAAKAIGTMCQRGRRCQPSGELFTADRRPPGGVIRTMGPDLGRRGRSGTCNSGRAGRLGCCAVLT